MEEMIIQTQRTGLSKCFSFPRCLVETGALTSELCAQGLKTWGVDGHSASRVVCVCGRRKLDLC